MSYSAIYRLAAGNAEPELALSHIRELCQPLIQQALFDAWKQGKLIVPDEAWMDFSPEFQRALGNAGRADALRASQSGKVWQSLNPVAATSTPDSSGQFDHLNAEASSRPDKAITVTLEGPRLERLVQNIDKAIADHEERAQAQTDAPTDEAPTDLMEPMSDQALPVTDISEQMRARTQALRLQDAEAVKAGSDLPAQSQTSELLATDPAQPSEEPGFRSGAFYVNQAELTLQVIRALQKAQAEKLAAFKQAYPALFAHQTDWEAAKLAAQSADKLYKAFVPSANDAPPAQPEATEGLPQGESNGQRPKPYKGESQLVSRTEFHAGLVKLMKDGGYPSKRQAVIQGLGFPLTQNIHGLYGSLIGTCRTEYAGYLAEQLGPQILAPEETLPKA